MKLLSRLSVGIAVGVLVSACAGSRPELPDTAAARVPQQGNWFCQMSASGQGWDCVQDRELAGNPRPDRLPAPSPPPEPMTPPDPAPLPTGSPMDQPAAPPQFDRDDAPPPGSDAVPPEPAPPAASGRPAADASPANLADEVPEHVRLAYRPDGPVALTDLPEDFYAVQLLAMSSKEALESFVAREQISGMSAARVERNGELYFVLLLGIYESADIAREAVASLPPEIGGAEPWVRPLGSLQSAMLRADSLAGAQRF
jgi:septal ring-binding cell division protein DamX